MNRLNCFVFIGLSAALTGCAKDQSLSPPVDNEYVTVTIKVPPQMKAVPMRVMYRSSVCKQASHDGDFRRTEIEGYNAIEVQPQRRGETDLYEAKLARHGGGQCNWKLSNVTFAVVYENPLRFGANVTTIGGGGGGVVVVFDHNNSQRGGADFFVNGDLSLRKDYYPWLGEVFLGGHVKDISLYSGGPLYLKYRVQNLRHVYFEPIVHADLIVKSIGPKIKKKGNNPVFTYSDGRVVADGRTEPDLRILEAIRIASEIKQ